MHIMLLFIYVFFSTQVKIIFGDRKGFLFMIRYNEYNLDVLGDRIRTRRKALNMSQENLVYAMQDCGCPIGRNSLSKLENNRLPRELSFKEIITLCNILQCDIDYLFNRDSHKTSELKISCELTGLSESAIDILQLYNYVNANPQVKISRLELLDIMLTKYTHSFSWLLSSIIDYLVQINLENLCLGSNPHGNALINCLESIQSMNEVALKDSDLLEIIKENDLYRTAIDNLGKKDISHGIDKTKEFEKELQKANMKRNRIHNLIITESK